MKKIRIHNDIAIEWAILTDGEPRNLEGREITCILRNTKGFERHYKPTIQGNVLRWAFGGKEQTSLGVYQAIAQDKTQDGLLTLDVVDAFELVPHTYQQGGEDAEGFNTWNVMLTSDIHPFAFKTINGEKILGEGNIELPTKEDIENMRYQSSRGIVVDNENKTIATAKEQDVMEFASKDATDISPNGASIVLREAGRIGAGTGTNSAQAPRIGFNWLNRWWGQILFMANTFKFVRGATDTAWADIQAGIMTATKFVMRGASGLLQADGTTTNTKTINGESILGNGDIHIDRYTIPMRKYTDLLYGVKYSALDYPFAERYFQEHYTPMVGGCSVVRKGNKIARNLDWYYDYEVEFIVETDAGLDRHATRGIAGTIKELTKSIVAGGVSGDLAKILPFRLLDGVNDAGLMASVNIVNENATRSIDDAGTTPLLEQRERICVAMIVRYVLDNFASARDACTYIKNYVSIYSPIVDGKKSEVQLFIADKEKSYVMSFEGSDVITIDRGFYGVLTNFRLADTGLHNGIYDIDNSNIEDLGSGIERANIALSMMQTSPIEDIIDTLKYTHAYEQGSTRYTEFVGINGTTIHSSIDELQTLQSKARREYIYKRRENRNIWHTTHTIIYDLDAKNATLSTQEIDDGYSIKDKIIPFP